MYSDIIGVVGGMGSYATADFFKKLIDAFPAEKEWDRPRIIIDNNSTMPSRVKIIIDERETKKRSKDRDVLLHALCTSIRHLVNMGCTKIILACNTSHVYIPEIKSKLNYITNGQYELLNIIEIAAKKMQTMGITSTLLIATEGTIYSDIYTEIFRKYNIQIKNIDESQFTQVRYFIECVKQNKITDDTYDKFFEYLLSFGYNNIILGCTELPILFSKIEKKIEKLGVKVHDPLAYTIEYLQKNIKTQDKLEICQ